MSPAGQHGNSRAVDEVIEANSAEFRRQAVNSHGNFSTWTKLYAANQALLLAMRDAQVSAALVEICSNLLGCEEVAIVEIELQTGAIHFVLDEGLSSERRECLTRNSLVLESRIHPGNCLISSYTKDDTANLDALGISALVPLWADGQTSGALVLFRLLPHRNGFDEEDREILQLLSMYAGPCFRSQEDGD